VPFIFHFAVPQASVQSDVSFVVFFLFSIVGSFLLFALAFRTRELKIEPNGNRRHRFQVSMFLRLLDQIGPFRFQIIAPYFRPERSSPRGQMQKIKYNI
jgi:hypothetical protein